MRPQASYWGAAGEQIDLRSGNLNFTVPLLTAKARGGWSATIALSYNSQDWRKDTGGEWNLGKDVGFGRGWRLQVGSVVPVYSGAWNLHHWVFTDATGAEYRLDQNNGGVWTSKEGLYVSFEEGQSTLCFPDGTRWAMYSQSAGNEEDAGTMYPTNISDTNGNSIGIAYAAGDGVAYVDSSARIKAVYDTRAQFIPPAYVFTYNSDPIPHLTGITSNTGDGQNYTLSYLANQPLLSPFAGGAVFGVTTHLQSVATTGLGVSTSFLYNTSGEMTQMTTPMGGNL